MRTIYLLLLIAFGATLVAAEGDGAITVFALGAFHHPGPYALVRGKTNVGELIKSAGGLRQARLYGDFGGVEVCESPDPKTSDMKGKKKYVIRVYSEQDKAKTEKLLAALPLENGDVVTFETLNKEPNQTLQPTALLGRG